MVTKTGRKAFTARRNSVCSPSRTRFDGTIRAIDEATVTDLLAYFTIAGRSDLRAVIDDPRLERATATALLERYGLAGACRLVDRAFEEPLLVACGVNSLALVANYASVLERDARPNESRLPQKVQWLCRRVIAEQSAQQDPKASAALAGAQPLARPVPLRSRSGVSKRGAQ